MLTVLKRYRLAAVLSGIILVVIIGVVAALLLRLRWKWAAIPMPQSTATVVKKMPPAELAKLLRDKNKLRSEGAFRQAARSIGLQSVESGIYQLPKTADPLQLAKLFAQGPTLLKVTFPEGWTAHQMAARLSEEGVSAAGRFRHLAYPVDKEFSPWEGMLYPDTYFLSPKISAQKIIKTLHQHYVDVMHQLPRPFPQWAPGKVLSPAQLTTLASLVERETSVPGERPIIAGVLLNRLRKKMRLQCDATVQYARSLAEARGQLPQGHKSRLTFSDLKIDSPFNTYRHKGLPPTPICNPGKASLEAAARPQKTDYLFYVWSPHEKRHLFAKTYAQHLHNIRLIKKQEAG